MKYAVVKIGGSQFKVSEGLKLEVDKLEIKEGEPIKFEEVFLLVNDKETKIGKPTVKGAVVKAKVLKQFLGEKLDIFKYKAKTGYRRKMGFRPQRTLLEIQEITV